MGANHLDKIPARYFSKWASDCEILNSLEFLGSRHLRIEQIEVMKDLIDNLFKDDSLYKSLLIPSYNRLGSLLQVFTPEELKTRLDFNDSDTIFELGKRSFWSEPQSRDKPDRYYSFGKFCLQLHRKRATSNRF